MERLLDEYPVKYVSITAASNVTGYVNDVYTLARMTHEHDALIVVDGAQPYVFRLLGLPNTVEEEEESASTPGMVRVSLGVYNTEEEIDVLLSTVRGIAEQ